MSRTGKPEAQAKEFGFSFACASGFLNPDVYVN